MKDERAVIDSAVLIASLRRRDALHERAWPILQAADAGDIPPLVLTDFILAETLNHVVRKDGSAQAREALRLLEASTGFRIERVSDAVFARGKDEVFRSEDGLSFVDALTVAFMQDRGLRRIYSFDADFDRVRGLKRLVEVAR